MNRLRKTTKKAVKVGPFMTRQEIHSLKLAYRMMHLKHGNMSLAIGLGVLTLINAIRLSVITAWMIACTSRPDTLWMDLAIAAVYIRMFGIGWALSRYLERLASHKVALVGIASLRHTVYRILADRLTNNIAALRRGEILARTGGDVDSVGGFVVKSVLPVAVTTITGLGTVISFAFYSPLATLALALCLLLTGVVGPMLTIQSARIAGLVAQHAQTEFSTSTQALLMNVPKLAVSERLSEAKEHLESVEQDIQALKDQATRPAAIASFINNFAMGLAVLCGFLIGTSLVLSGRLWDVSLAVLMLTPLAASEDTAQLAPTVVQLTSSRAATSRLVELMRRGKSVEATLERIQRKDQKEVLTASHPIVVIPSDEADTAGARKSENTAATDAASTVEIKPVLIAQDLAIGWLGDPVVAHGINLGLRPGEALAVVGQSGIGKSTLLYTLAGLIQPASDTLTLGGKPLNEIPREDVATMIIMTAGDAHIFQTSVLESIRVSRNSVGSVEAEKLMIQAGMGTWLQAAPHGLETTLGMDGVALSGEERRHILLTRASASPVRLLALDKPGERLDEEMVDQLIGDLLTTGKSEERGVLLVTHCLSALGAADGVLAIAKTGIGGTTEVIAHGTHAELVEGQAEYRWALEQEKIYV